MPLPYMVCVIVHIHATESRNETVKIDYGVEDSCIGNEGTERQKKKDKKDLTRQCDSMQHRRAAHTDQQRQAILYSREEEHQFVFMLIMYKLSFELRTCKCFTTQARPMMLLASV